MNLKSQQDPAFLRAGHARHVPHTENRGRLVFAGVRIVAVNGAAPVLDSHGPLQFHANFTLIGARLGAVSLKAARLKAARLKAVMGFPEKLTAVSRGVRKHEHPTDRGAREDGCGV